MDLSAEEKQIVCSHVNRNGSRFGGGTPPEREATSVTQQQVYDR